MDDDKKGPAHAALNLITKMQSEHEAEIVASATCFIVVTVDLDHGSITYNGPFPPADPVTAFRAAEAHETDLNKVREPGDLGYRCKVVPVSYLEGCVTL